MPNSWKNLRKMHRGGVTLWVYKYAIPEFRKLGWKCVYNRKKK
jgi:hypothetical protein